MHLHKSFIELHFAGRELPQLVSVQACVDGKNLSLQLPGQVYSTSCGQDHWLLGLQYVFKAFKEPVITHVDMAGDALVNVAIATQGVVDKYSSSDPARRAELQRALEAAALKFAQVRAARAAEPVRACVQQVCRYRARGDCCVPPRKCTCARARRRP